MTTNKMYTFDKKQQKQQQKDLAIWGKVFYKIYRLGKPQLQGA